MCHWSEPFFAHHATLIRFGSNGIKLRWKKYEVPSGMNVMPKFLLSSNSTGWLAVLVPMKSNSSWREKSMFSFLVSTKSFLFPACGMENQCSSDGWSLEWNRDRSLSE